MKHPKKIIIDGEEYIYIRKVYKDCYLYRNYWLNAYGRQMHFNKYLEKGNTLYYIYQKYLKGEKIYNDIQFID